MIPPWVKFVAVAAVLAVTAVLGATWAARYYKVKELRSAVAGYQLTQAMTIKLFEFKDQIETAAAARVAAQGAVIDQAITETRQKPAATRLCRDYAADERRGLQNRILTGPALGARRGR